MKRASLFVVGLALSLGIAGSPRVAEAAPSASSLASADVTIYGATWCSACKALESGLRARQIPFEVVDVDKNPASFERARAAASAGTSIPLTGVAQGSETAWIVGSDVDGVERLYRSK